MASIPSTNFGIGLDEYALPFRDGVHKLINEAGIANVTNVVDGMLFHIGSVDIIACTNEQQRVMCQARASVLREIKGHIIERMSPTDLAQEERNNGFDR